MLINTNTEMYNNCYFLIVKKIDYSIESFVSLIHKLRNTYLCCAISDLRIFIFFKINEVTCFNIILPLFI